MFFQQFFSLWYLIFRGRYVIKEIPFFPKRSIKREIENTLYFMLIYNTTFQRNGRELTCFVWEKYETWSIYVYYFKTRWGNSEGGPREATGCPAILAPLCKIGITPIWMQLLGQLRPFFKSSWKELFLLSTKTLWYLAKLTEKIAFKVSKSTIKFWKNWRKWMKMIFLLPAPLLLPLDAPNVYPSFPCNLYLIKWELLNILNK